MLVNDHWIADLRSATFRLGDVQKAVYDVIALFNKFSSPETITV